MVGEDKIYLDYAATTPVSTAVLAEMMSYFRDKFGNAGSIHTAGQEAQAAIDLARAKIAGYFKADPEEIIFTGSATESNNLAIRGIAEGFTRALEYASHGSAKVRPHVITSAIEHESVLETCRDLEKSGRIDLTILTVNKGGAVRLEDVEGALRSGTILVSIMYANNETGAIEPIQKVATLLREKRENSERKTIYPLFHTDAVQAIQYLECNIKKLGADLLTFSGHKIYGPKGIGGLYISKEIKSYLVPIITGGGQEFGLRSGTENVPYIVGLAKAFEEMEMMKEDETPRVRKLRDELVNGIITFVPEARLISGEIDKLPNIAAFMFPKFRNEELVMALDLKGVQVSSGSACSAKSFKFSHVLEALGIDKDSGAAVRFSLGRSTTEKNIKQTLEVIKSLCE